MKTKLLFFYACIAAVVSTATGTAQTTVETSAEVANIAIQGIARDDSNNARIEESIIFSFKLYYMEEGTEEEVYSKSDPITTDAFGVFSHILEVPADRGARFANRQIFLKIIADNVEISNEPLNHVPYAVSANNGVPTGAIMPFVGAEAPYGWLLCDGRSFGDLPGDPKQYAELKRVLGASQTKLPDLRSMFLRGAGDDDRSSTETVGLNATQDDALKAHAHNQGDLRTSTSGNHNHSITRLPTDSSPGSYSDMMTLTHTNGADERWNNIWGGNNATNTTGNHTHNISGNTGSTGAGETRPISYGVNYIIKL